MGLTDVLTHPPNLRRALVRERVRELLLGAEEPGRLVVAPSGSGKTVAAAQLVDDPPSGFACGWCRMASVAAGGEDLIRLAAAALGSPVDSIGAGPLERAATLLDALGERSLLVIDDYDLARAEECDPVLAEVLALAPPECRIVVCSSARPAGLLGRASMGHYRLIGPQDLAFDVAEVAELLLRWDQDPATAGELLEASGGWASAVALMAEAPLAGRAGLGAAIEALLAQDPLVADPAYADLVTLLASLPSVNIESDVLGEVASRSALLQPVGDGWGLVDLARAPLRALVGEKRMREVALRLAPRVAETDPVAAAGLLIDVGQPESAADLLANHASGVPSDAALPLLYRLPADVRRRLPPVLSDARATVEMDHALADAEQRLAASAPDSPDRIEAQVALGTLLVHRGQLSSASGLLESALRRATGRAEATIPAAAGWLGLARLWAGDIAGAAAAVRAIRDPAEPSPLACWVQAEAAFAEGSSSRAEEAQRDVARSGWTTAIHAVAARLALELGDESGAVAAASAGYEAAMQSGGLDLVVAAPVHAWCLARAGRWAEAASVADALRRGLGRLDTCARLHADLVHEAAAVAAGDRPAAARHARSIAMTRTLGYAVVEQAARRWLPSPEGETPPAGLEVALLGPVEVRIDGEVVDEGRWRSRKAREVLLVLTRAGESGLSRDEVVEAVWPDREPGRGRTLLRTALAEIRRVLEPRRLAGEQSRFVSTRSDRIVLRASSDVTAVEQALTDPDVVGLVQAWRRFRGAAVADEPYAESLDELRHRADRLRLDLADALLTRIREVDPEVLASVAEHVLSAEPWRTDVAQQVADACRAAGDDVTAARVERYCPGTEGRG